MRGVISQRRFDLFNLLRMAKRVHRNHQQRLMAVHGSDDDQGFAFTINHRRIGVVSGHDLCKEIVFRDRQMFDALEDRLSSLLRPLGGKFFGDIVERVRQVPPDSRRSELRPYAIQPPPTTISPS